MHKTENGPFRQMVFLQRISDGRFYCDGGTWVADKKDAKDFTTSVRAVIEAAVILDRTKVYFHFPTFTQGDFVHVIK